MSEVAVRSQNQSVGGDCPGGYPVVATYNTRGKAQGGANHKPAAHGDIDGIMALRGQKYKHYQIAINTEQKATLGFNKNIKLVRLDYLPKFVYYIYKKFTGDLQLRLVLLVIH